MTAWKHAKINADKITPQKLKQFFSNEQIEIMRDAVTDHRSSLEYIPRNIYGKILSSADRKVDIDNYMHSSMGFQKNKDPNSTDEDGWSPLHLVAKWDHFEAAEYLINGGANPNQVNNDGFFY